MERTRIENWHKEEKGTYLDQDPTILYFNENSRAKSKIVDLIKNGNITELRSIKIENKLYSIINTCVCDIIFQTICNVYINSDVYSDWLNLNINGINSQTYKKRPQIRKHLISEYKEIKKTANGLIILDSSCTA